MKSSNKLLAISVIGIAVSAFVVANIVYANFSAFNHGKTIDGNGQFVTHVTPVTPFNSIHVSGLANIIVEKGNTNQVNMSADQNLFPYMKTIVKNNQLYIGSQKDVYLNPSQAMNIIITSTTGNLSEISTAGKITFTAKNMRVNTLNVKMGGKTKMTLSGAIKNADLDLAGKSAVNLCDIRAKNINFKTAGKSQINLCGHASNLTIKSAGKTEINAKNFTAVNLAVLGTGHMYITSHVLKSLQVNVLGKAHVNYYGNPKVMDKSFGKVVLKKIRNVP